MIYDTIKGICMDQNISVSSLEKRANLGNGTIGKWKKSSPSIENLQAVAIALNVKIEKLLI